MEERGLSSGFAWLTTEPLDNKGKFVYPSSSLLGALIIDSFLESINDQSIDALDLAIGPWVSD